MFPLEDDDIGPRRGPPQPLANIVGDLDEAMPSRPLAAHASRRQAEGKTKGSGESLRSAQTRPDSRPGAPAAVKTRERPERPRQDLRPAPPTAEQLAVARQAYEDAESDLHRSEYYTARPYKAYVAPSPPAIGVPNWAIMTVIVVASLLVITMLGGRDGVSLSNWGLQFVSAITGVDLPEQALSRPAGLANPVGDYRLLGAPSISAEQIDRILASYGSPAAGTGAAWYDLGRKYEIDPAFAIAFFIHESSAGTNPNWAGIKPGGATTHNVGNIICAGYASCYGRFRDYSSWEAGIEDWYRLIAVEYLQGRGHQTVADIIPVYAPSFENDVELYVNTIGRLVDEWRRGEVP